MNKTPSIIVYCNFPKLIQPLSRAFTFDGAHIETEKNAGVLRLLRGV